MKALARVLLALFLYSVPGLAQEIGGGTMRGQILPAEGESELPGIVTVRIIGPGIQQVTYVSGNFFSFDGLRDGNYTIYVSANGREEVAHEVSAFSADRNDLITVVLGDRASEEEVPPEGDTVVDLKTLQVPRKAHEQLQKGLEYLEKAEFDKAAQHFEAATQIAPSFFQAHNNLGVACLKRNKIEEAERHFARAMEIQPENLITLKNLAYVRMNLGRYSEAIDPLAKAVRLDSNDAKAEMYLGEAYVMNKEEGPAKEHFLKAIVLDPVLAHAYYRLGFIFVKEKQYGEALKHFQGYLKLDPDQGKDEAESMVAKLQQYFKDTLARATTSPVH